jgi:hypothetical protein
VGTEPPEGALTAPENSATTAVRSSSSRSTTAGNRIVPAVVEIDQDRVSLALIEYEMGGFLLEMTIITWVEHDQLQRHETFDVGELARARARFADETSRRTRTNPAPKERANR